MQLRMLIASVGIFAIVGENLIACPNCKEGLAAGGAANAQQLARGFELSIYLMLGMPMFILATLGTVFYLQIRRARNNPELWQQAQH